MSSMQEANSERHYIMLVIAIVIGLVGVYLRFADFRHASLVANIIMACGAGLGLKVVFSIIK
jgi:hypothetical protein